MALICFLVFSLPSLKKFLCTLLLFLLLSCGLSSHAVAAIMQGSYSSPSFVTLSWFAPDVPRRLAAVDYAPSRARTRNVYFRLLLLLVSEVSAFPPFLPTYSNSPLVRRQLEKLWQSFCPGHYCYRCSAVASGLAILSTCSHRRACARVR
jgi:hypothetical protein